VLLLCLTVAVLIPAVATGLTTWMSLEALEHVDSSEETLPGGALIGAIVGSAAAWLGFLVAEFALACVGFFAALVNIRIAPFPGIRAVSKAFLILYFVVIALVVLGPILLSVLT
jgi:hypothetical protein